jgi:hypothetical protein
MRPAVRKLSLAAHVAFSLGWLGADAAFLLLAIVGLTAQDLLAARSAYVSMEPMVFT